MKVKFALGLLISSVLSLFFIISPAIASSPKTQLKQYVSDLQNDPNNQELREKIIKFVLSMNTKPNLSDEFVIQKGKAFHAMKSAQNPEDFKNAANEFEKASLLAPWRADIYYNMGLADQAAGMADEAVQSFKLYLVAKPHANDRAAVLEKIGEVEDAGEKKKKLESFEGEWCWDGDCDQYYPLIIGKDNSGNYFMKNGDNPEVDKKYGIKPEGCKFYQIEVNGKNISYWNTGSSVVLDKSGNYAYVFFYKAYLTDDGKLVNTGNDYYHDGKFISHNSASVTFIRVK